MTDPEGEDVTYRNRSYLQERNKSQKPLFVSQTMVINTIIDMQSKETSTRNGFTPLREDKH